MTRLSLFPNQRETGPKVEVLQRIRYDRDGLHSNRLREKEKQKPLPILFYLSVIGKCECNPQNWKSFLSPK